MYYYIGIILLALLAFQLLLSMVLQFRRARSTTTTAILEREFLQQKFEQLVVAGSTQREPPTEAWKGWRKFRVCRIEEENATIKSFYLKPHDGKPLSHFKPGQHLTFRLMVPGQSKPVVRCYSLSDSVFTQDHAQNAYYRVTIRKQPAPADSINIPDGVSSSYFYDHVNASDILDVKAPPGRFFLDVSKKTPVVMIAGGVGITPSLSMLNTLFALDSRRQVWLFYAVRNEADIVMAEHLMHLSKVMKDLQVHFFCEDIELQRLTPFRHKGYVSVRRMLELGAPLSAEFFICGPPPMMKAITTSLEDYSVAQERIRFESFGPPTLITKLQQKPVSKESVAKIKAKSFSIAYDVSNKSAHWDPSHGTLLEACEAAGVDIDTGCRAGNCGSCITALLSGDVSYINEPGMELEKGTCLPCIAVPRSDIKLNA